MSRARADALVTADDAASLSPVERLSPGMAPTATQFAPNITGLTGLFVGNHIQPIAEWYPEMCSPGGTHRFKMRVANSSRQGSKHNVKRSHCRVCSLWDA